MKKQKEINQNSIPDGVMSRVRFFGKAVLIFIPIFLTLVMFPLIQSIQANNLPYALYYTVYYLAQIIQMGAIFLFLALVSLLVKHREREEARRMMLMNLLSLVVFFALLEGAVYLLFAYIDSLYILPFSLCNQTLSILLDAGGFNFVMLLLNLVSNALVMALSVFVSYVLLKRYRSINGFKKHESKGYALNAVIGYLAVSVALMLFDNIMLFIDSGFSSDISDILYILMPYAESGIYAVCGYFLIEYTLRYFEDQI